MMLFNVLVIEYILCVVLCYTEETKVIDSRLVSDGFQVRRRRECGHCKERFTTFESAEMVIPKIIKSDNSRQPFDENKLRRGMLHALEKRPVSSDDVEKSISYIVHQLQATGERRSAISLEHLQ